MRERESAFLKSNILSNSCGLWLLGENKRKKREKNKKRKEKKRNELKAGKTTMINKSSVSVAVSSQGRRRRRTSEREANAFLEMRADFHSRRKGTFSVLLLFLLLILILPSI